MKSVRYAHYPFTTVTAYLVFDRSNIALLSPVDCVWKIKVYVWRQIGCAISWSVYVTTEAIHQLHELICLLR